METAWDTNRSPKAEVGEPKESALEVTHHSSMGGTENEEFCPECGRPWKWSLAASTPNLPLRRRPIWSWILLAIGLSLIVATGPEVWADYHAWVGAETILRTASDSRDQFAASETAGMAWTDLTYDFQGIALAGLACAVGLGAVARRKLEATLHGWTSGEQAARPGRVPRQYRRAMLALWALGETIGESIFGVLLLIFALVVLGLLLQGVDPSLAVVDQARRETVAIAIRTVEAIRSYYP